MRRESLKYSTRQDKTIGAKQGRSRGGEGEKCDRLRREQVKRQHTHTTPSNSSRDLHTHHHPTHLEIHTHSLAHTDTHTQAHTHTHTHAHTRTHTSRTT